MNDEESNFPKNSFIVLDSKSGMRMLTRETFSDQGLSSIVNTAFENLDTQQLRPGSYEAIEGTHPSVCCNAYKIASESKPNPNEKPSAWYHPKNIIKFIPRMIEIQRMRKLHIDNEGNITRPGIEIYVGIPPLQVAQNIQENSQLEEVTINPI